MRFSDACQTETPLTINMNFCTIDYVDKVKRCAKNGWNQLAGGGPTYRWNITSTFMLYFTQLYITLLYFTFFFFYASTAQTAQPIYTHDSSNDAVWSKEVPFGGRV